jgi:hypothetical protein
MQSKEKNNERWEKDREVGERKVVMERRDEGKRKEDNAEVERESGSGCVERKRRGAARESGCVHGGLGGREISFKITG